MVSLMVDFETALNPVSLVKTKFRDELTKALSRIDTLCADRNAMKGQIHQMSQTQLDRPTNQIRTNLGVPRATPETFIQKKNPE